MFLAPAFLLGLLAIGVPLWLHRVTRANPTQQPFASLMFLEPSESQRTARHTIRYWLLLLLRIALLAALAFAFAGPLAPARITPRPDANARLHAIVLDASHSMRYGDRWDKAIAEAEAVVRSVKGADRLMLVLAGRRIEVVHESMPASNAGALLGSLRSVQPTLERLDFGLAMSTADSWLGSPRPQTVLHFISDLQRSGAPLHFAELEPPAGAQLVMHAVGEDRTANASIVDAQFADGELTTLQATVRHDATQTQRRTVSLAIDGRVHARQELELTASTVESGPLVPNESEGGGAFPASSPLLPPASGEGASSAVTVRFPDVDLAPGAHRIELSLDPRDALAGDDQHFAVIEHTDPKALLLSRDEGADDAAYFEAALGSLAAPRLTVEHRSINQLPESAALAAYSLAVIPDASLLSAAAAQRVLEYVAAGGAVLATLGARTEGGDTPLLDAWRIGDMRPQSMRVGEIATSHPVLRDGGDWRRVRFFRARAVDPGPDDKVLLAFEDGAPLLVERVVGAGKLLVLTAPIERSWNDLAIHPLFVHFIADAGRYLTGADAKPASHIAGSTVMTGLTAAQGGQIFDPRGERVLSLAAANQAERLIPQLTGFYEIRGGAATRWLAVNTDARESDLRPLGADFIQRWQALRMRAAPSAAAANEPAEAPRSVGPWLMWIAGLLLAAELLIANRYLAIRRK